MLVVRFNLLLRNLFRQRQKMAAVKAAINLADFGGGAESVRVLGVTVVQIQPVRLNRASQILGQPLAPTLLG